MEEWTRNISLLWGHELEGWETEVRWRLHCTSFILLTIWTTLSLSPSLSLPQWLVPRPPITSTFLTPVVKSPFLSHPTSQACLTHVAHLSSLKRFLPSFQATTFRWPDQANCSVSLADPSYSPTFRCLHSLLSALFSLLHYLLRDLVQVCALITICLLCDSPTHISGFQMHALACQIAPLWHQVAIPNPTCFQQKSPCSPAPDPQPQTCSSPCLLHELLGPRTWELTLIAFLTYWETI